MQGQFDFKAAVALKRNGIKRVTDNSHGWVQEARQKAIEYARAHGTVCSDDIHRIFPKPPELSPNSLGAIFNTKQLKIIGYTKSERVSGHSRRICVYEAVQ